MQTFFQDFTRDDGTLICVEYGYGDLGAHVMFEDAWRKADEHMEDAPRIELSDDERDRFEAWIMEHRWHDDHMDDGE